MGSSSASSTDGTYADASLLLIATGIRDACPDIAGIRALVGRGVCYCAYCDAYTVRDRPLAALGPGRTGAERALALTTWGPTVTLCTNGGSVSKRWRQTVERVGVAVRCEPIVRVEGRRALERLVFA